MKIGLFADSHGANLDIPNSTRMPRLSKQKIREAMEAFVSCDLVICLGDLVDDCGSRAENICYLRELAEIIRSYRIPFLQHSR